MDDKGIRFSKDRDRVRHGLSRDDLGFDFDDLLTEMEGGT
jgi:hypothetical protein